MEMAEQKPRGCGMRKPGAYAVTELSGNGRPLEDFLLCPPHEVVPAAFGLAAIKSVIIETPGKPNHIMDWIGAQHYPHAADFIEEIRAMGMSRKLSPHLIKNLEIGSKLLAVHPEGYFHPHGDAPFLLHNDFRAEWGDNNPRSWNLCPKGIDEHMIDFFRGMCSGLWWEDIVEVASLQFGRVGLREMPSFNYLAASPIDAADYAPAIIGAFPIHRIEIVVDPLADSHEYAHEESIKSGLPTQLVDF